MAELNQEQTEKKPVDFKTVAIIILGVLLAILLFSSVENRQVVIVLAVVAIGAYVLLNRISKVDAFDAIEGCAEQSFKKFSLTLDTSPENVRVRRIANIYTVFFVGDGMRFSYNIITRQVEEVDLLTNGEYIHEVEKSQIQRLVAEKGILPSQQKDF